jgi:hypothetical protein
MGLGVAISQAAATGDLLLFAKPPTFVHWLETGDAISGATQAPAANEFRDPVCLEFWPPTA